MTPSRRALLALVMAQRFTSAHAAEAWPSRPVQVIVPIAPGGPTDVIGRLIARHLSVLLGQPFVVDNRGGAGGQIGMRMAATAAADGYTILIGNAGSVAINPSYQKNVGYDSLADFVFASTLMSAPVFLVVRADLPVRTVPELVEHIRRSRGRFAFASSGQGQSPDIAARYFLKSAGLEAEVAAYRGAAPAVVDLLGGVVGAMFDSTTGLPHIREGRLRAIAVAGLERSALLPSVPTMSEQGYSGFDMTAWSVAMLPAGTPEAILRRLSEAIGTIMNLPDVVAQIEGQNAQPLPCTPDEARRFVETQVATWRGVLHTLNLRAE